VHAATEAQGNSVSLPFGPGQRHNVTRRHEMLDGLTPRVVISDKGPDADALCDKGVEAVIPPRSNRKSPHTYDEALYR